jgi:hypothetical protein
VFALAALSIALFSVSSSRHEALYEGVLAVGGSLSSGVWTLPSPGKLPTLARPWVILRDPQSKVLVVTPLGRILIHCPQSVPDALTQDPAAFDRWVRKNCEFSPLWSPAAPSP